jgi:OOP family OmpA-OmpF porin
VKITPLGKAVLVAAFFGAAGFGAFKMGYLTPEKTQASSVPPKIADFGSNAPSQAGYSQVNLQPVSSSSYTPKLMTIPWNATIGLMYANGAATTQPGSPMANHGVNLNIVREDDYSKMLAEMLAFASEVAKGNNQPSQGAALAIIMGDGYPAFIAGAQEQFGKLGQQLEVFHVVGYSRGEDKCMLPAEVKANPQLAKGSLIGAVLRDGDWNICVKWASDNGIRINPDEKTYDPDAMNFVAVDSFTQADEKLIAGYCEERKVTTGGKKRVCQNGTATWTPGDVTVARKKGGVVAVASTRDYIYQMPAIVIGNKQWLANNSAWVENFILASSEGGEAVRNSQQALVKGGAVMAAVNKEESADYWAKYYGGVTEKDSTGQLVQLGGSIANTLSDTAYLFGLSGGDNIYKRVYGEFGKITKYYYPTLLPEVIPYDKVVNTRYLQSVVSKAQSMPAPTVPTFNASVNGNLVSKKAYLIEFETGKASFTPAATSQLNDLLNSVAVTGLAVQIDGHTDNVGSQETNIALSKRRADAVKNWLMLNSSTITDQRVRTRAYGDMNPVADNRSSDGRARNRRVEVTLSAQ